MFRARTCFVIGAGASVEAGFPAGAQLLATIAEMLALRYVIGNRLEGGDGVINRILLNKAGGQINDVYQTLFQAARRISEAAQIGLSIDNIIEQHDDDENVQFCGKLAIVKAILEAEASSKLMPEPGQFKSNISAIDGSWYFRLAQMLAEGLPRRNIRDIFQNVDFVTFNYDRSLEYYLPRALGEIYGVDDSQINEAMAGLRVVHPYGTVGALPQASQRGGVNYGDTDRSDLVNLVPNIRTFSERIEDPQELFTIREPLSLAEQVVFLGFAYHRQNLDLIAPPAPVAKRVFGSVMGISVNDQSFIRDQLASIFDVHPHRCVTLEPVACANILADSWRSLTGEP